MLGVGVGEGHNLKDDYTPSWLTPKRIFENMCKIVHSGAYLAEKWACTRVQDSPSKQHTNNVQYPYFVEYVTNTYERT